MKPYFPRRAPREPEAHRPWEHQTLSRTRIDPPTSDISGTSISLSASQLDILNRRQQQKLQSHSFPRDPSVIMTTTSNPVPLQVERETMIPATSSDTGHSRIRTPIRTRNPVSRDNSGNRTNSPVHGQQVYDNKKYGPAIHSVSSDGNISMDVLKNMAQRRVRNKQVASSSNSSNGMRQADKVAPNSMAAALRQRIRRNRKDDTKSSGVSVSTIDPSSEKQVDFHQYAGDRSGRPNSVSVAYPAKADQASASLATASQLHAVASSATTASVTEASETTEEEPEGFVEFVEILQAETSGQHSQVRLDVESSSLLRSYHLTQSFS
jgi:hypothetical protein